MLWLLSFWLALSASASEQSELLTCFESARLMGEGPGISIAAFERWPSELRATVVVTRADKDGEGFWVFTDGAVYAQPIPRKHLGSAYTVVPFELRLADRDPFRCVYRRVPAFPEAGKVECSLVDRESSYETFKPRALPRPWERLHPLRSAVLQRIHDIPARLQRQARKYEKDMADYERRQKEPPTLFGSLADRLGWQRLPPSKPSRGPARRALGPCLSVEDELVRSAATSALSFLDMIGPAD